MEKLSVTIITRNEEKNIARCLESVKWADEIIVLDTNSTDRTVEICRQFTDQVFCVDWHGYGKQKNLCADRASHNWVLNIDSDEEISAEGAEEIRGVLRDGPKHPIYQFPRKNFFAQRWVRYGGWYPDRISRLYDKTQVSFTESQVHEKLVPDEKVGSLRNPILHYSFSGMEDYIDRQNRYSTLYASEKMGQGFCPGWSHLMLRPPAAFLRNYIIRQGFRDGFLGLFLALSSAFYTFLKYAKIKSTR
ncbi:MAG: glycosyltransferase family 2 protein [Nitrospinae bacterium]|nr:glycosyltransferase family 2 protein [Nitrospinota bacterium]MBL7020444.1 glycosyltransferase family 2 protein [Nitrospinaceae bacterium]